MKTSEDPKQDPDLQPTSQDQAPPAEQPSQTSQPNENVEAPLFQYLTEGSDPDAIEKK